MSLGSWFRDYVYIPLGGNRVSKLRWYLNIFIVWFLTGFWHGADWSFIAWGLMFAVLLVLEKLFLGKFLKKHKIIAHIYVPFFTMISFILFNASNTPAALAGESAFAIAWRDIISLFGAGGIPLVSAEALYYLRSYAMVYLMAIIGATPALKCAVKFIKNKKYGEMVINAIEPIVMLALLVVITAFIVDSTFSPFLYFRF